MKFIICISILFFSAGTFAESGQEFEDRYYKLLTKYIDAQMKSNDIQRLPDGSEAKNVEDKIKIQKSRDCVTWKANKEFIVHIIDNFDVYEPVRDKTQLIQSKKFEWIENLDYLNSNINNPENNCK